MIKIIVFLVFICYSGSINAQCIDPLWHNSSANSIWLSCDKSPNPLTELGSSHWILYEFDNPQPIKNMRIWNISHPSFIKNGVKKVRLDVSTNGAAWINKGVLELELGSSFKNYSGELFEDFEAYSAKYILLTVLENHGGGTCSGLAEVLFNLGESTTPTDDEYLSSRINIYPNPADQYFQITLEGIATRGFSYQLSDLTGRVIITDFFDKNISNSEININVSHLADGQYALNIKTDEGSVIKKIVVIHPR